MDRPYRFSGYLPLRLATPELATRTGAHLLDQDPVSTAETMDRARSGSGHTSASSGPPWAA